MTACAAERVCAHRGEDAIGISGRKNSKQLAFVGDVKRVETEDLARAFDFLADGNLRFVEQHAHPCALRDLAQRAGDAAARRIAQNVDVFARVED